MIICRQSPTPNWEQSAAVAHLTIGTEAIAIVEGKAGTGKTRMLKTAAELWAGAGYKVFGACVAGKAARGLHNATGIQTDTVAKLLFDANSNIKTAVKHYLRQLKRAALGRPTFAFRKSITLDSKSVLILDDAAMIGTQDLQRILREVERTKAKVVLVGDAKQLQHVDRRVCIGRHESDVFRVSQPRPECPSRSH